MEDVKVFVFFFQFDSGIQRFMSMRATEFEHFKPTPKSSLYGLGFVVLPIAIFAYLVKTTRVSQLCVLISIF